MELILPRKELLFHFITFAHKDGDVEIFVRFLRHLKDLISNQ